MKKFVGMLALVLATSMSVSAMASAAEPRAHLDLSAGVTTQRDDAQNVMTYDTVQATLSTQIKKLTIFGTASQNYLQHTTDMVNVFGNKRQLTTLGGGAVLRLSNVTSISGFYGTQLDNGLDNVRNAQLQHVMNVTVTTRAF